MTPTSPGAGSARRPKSPTPLESPTPARVFQAFAGGSHTPARFLQTVHPRHPCLHFEQPSCTPGGSAAASSVGPASSPTSIGRRHCSSASAAVDGGFLFADVFVLTTARALDGLFFFCLFRRGWLLRGGERGLRHESSRARVFGASLGSLQRRRRRFVFLILHLSRRRRTSSSRQSRRGHHLRTRRP